jgi:hypothetical protein
VDMQPPGPLRDWAKSLVDLDTLRPDRSVPPT